MPLTDYIRQWILNNRIILWDSSKVNTLGYLPNYITCKIFTYLQQEIVYVSVLMELTLNSIINMSSSEPSSYHSMIYMLLSWSLHLLRYVYSDQLKVLGIINSKVGGVEKPGSYVYVQFQTTTWPTRRELARQRKKPER